MRAPFCARMSQSYAASAHQINKQINNIFIVVLVKMRRTEIENTQATFNI